LATEEVEALIHVLLILIVAKALEEGLARVRQPAVLGDILAGILLGPTVLGLIVLPEHIHSLAWLGIVILIFLAGFETNPSEFRRYGLPAAIVGIGGVISCFTMGFALGALLGYPLHTSLFIGAILTPTSVGVTVATLEALGKLRSEEGYIVLGAAVFDDVYGVVVLSIVYAIAVGKVYSFGSYTSIILGLSILLLLFLAIPHYLGYIERFLMALRIPEAPFLVLFLIGLGASVISAHFGLTPIPGAFLIGLALSRIHSPESIRRDFQILERVITPIFFAYAGILLNPWEVNVTLDVLPIALSLAAIGLIGKVVGCGLAAKLARIGGRKSLIIGTAMMPRAGVDIVIAVTGLSLGVIDQVIYLAALILIYISSILTPPVVKLLYTRSEAA